MGYLGGGLLFTVNLLMVVKPAWFHLDGAAEAVRWSFLSVALWWLVFSLPLALFVKERRAAAGVGALAAVVNGLRELRGTLSQVKAYRGMFLFLVAYWLYIDGVNTIIKMAIDYGMALGFDSKALLAALLLVQFVAFPAALVFGRLGERFGPRRAVLAGLVVYTGISVWAYFLQTVAEFFAMAVVVGLVQGGVQSLSRSFFGRLVPPGKGAEFFGFYNMVGKFGTVIGPLLVGFVALLTGSSRGSIVSVSVLFIGGGLLLLRVQDPPAASAS
jgi:UMF1 family MFS transporter